MHEISERQPPISTLRLHEITEELGEIGLLQRLGYEIDKQDWPDAVRGHVYSAEKIAVAAHEEDTRGDHPYLTHILRTAIRVISEHHLNIRDPDLVVAALLHDTIEDHAEYYQKLVPPGSKVVDAREYALSIVEKSFGSSVAQIVQAVTNPKWSEDISEEEKNTLYQEHVRDVLAGNEMAGIIKLSDFIDNFSGQPYNEDPDLARRLTQKYLPLVPDFKKFIESSAIIPEDRKDYALQQFDHAKDRGIKLQTMRR